MEKLTFKKKKYKVETRQWRVGDLVKLIEYDITEIGTYSYGIITSHEGEDGYENSDGQLNMFPLLGIYTLDGRHIKTAAYNLEILSPA